MSRIGNNPIVIPEGVTVDIKGNEVVVKGKLGELTQDFSSVDIKVEDGQVVVERPSDLKDHKAKHGLYRALINNMIKGVSIGWTKQLELVGVGYRASNQGQKQDDMDHDQLVTVTASEGMNSHHNTFVWGP